MFLYKENACIQTGNPSLGVGKVVKSVSMGVYILPKNFSGKPSVVVTPKGSVSDSLDFLVFYGTNFPLCSPFLLLAFNVNSAC